MYEAELEIARLLNALRANPNGDLKRVKPPPACPVIEVDRQTGLYAALPTLEISEAVSVQVSRPWSLQMTRTLVHQPNGGSKQLEGAGIQWSAAGENIAWHSQRPNKAMVHFVSWRESDGHFCNMMNPKFTHVGIGEHQKTNGDSMATMNLYALR